MSTDPTTLPQFDGRPVPWVTRWTGETSPERYNYGIQPTGPNSFRLGYKDGQEVRDSHGVLWQREGLGRSGRPDWAAVSTYRQRQSMRKRKCQVCSKTITDKPIEWLMPIDGLEYLDEDNVVTMQPPTCSDCIPVALDLCPNLRRRGYMMLKVLDYSAWGVFGHVITMTEDGPRRFQSAICYDTSEYGGYFSLEHVMAQQLVVKLDRFVISETVEGKAPKAKDPYFAETLAALARESRTEVPTIVQNELSPLADPTV